MKRLLLSSLLLWALVPVALASTTWYVDGVHGSDNNDCKSPQTACKTIGHAISLASSGDSISVAAASYTENLGIGFSLKLIGASAKTTIIDGGGAGTVITIPNPSAQVAISQVTIRNGHASQGGGIYNKGILLVRNSTLSGNSAGFSGGGIFNSGTLTVNNDTLSGNSTKGIPQMAEAFPTREH